MQVHIVRSSAIEPGGARWSSLGDDELLMFVSSDAVTGQGARALERAWASFIDRGMWRFREEPAGQPISATYRPADLPEGTYVRFVECPPGHYDVALSSTHFSAAAVAGVQRCVSDSIGYGWTYHPAASIQVVRTRRTA